MRAIARPVPRAASSRARMIASTLAARPTIGKAGAIDGARSTTGAAGWDRLGGPRVAIADGLVAGGRGRERSNAELALQGGDAGAVLAKRRGPVARRVLELHQPDVATLVQWVQVQPPAGGLDRGRQVALGLGRRGEAIQDGQHGPFRGDRTGCSPIVEFRAVAQVEPGQERATCQARGRRQGGPVLGMGRRLHLDQVDAHPPSVEVHPRAIDDQCPIADGGSHRRQRPTKRPAGRHVIRIRPQQRGQLVTRERPGLRPKEREDGDGLAGVDGQRDAIDADLRRPEQLDLQSRDGASCPGHRVTVQTRTAIP